MVVLVVVSPLVSYLSLQITKLSSHQATSLVPLSRSRRIDQQLVLESNHLRMIPTEMVVRSSSTSPRCLAFRYIRLSTRPCHLRLCPTRLWVLISYTRIHNPLPTSTSPHPIPVGSTLRLHSCRGSTRRQSRRLNRLGPRSSRSPVLEGMVMLIASVAAEAVPTKSGKRWKT
jgi:hypothetical protein